MVSILHNFWLFVIIFCEGYAVLSAEILFIRQLVPFVGNGLESVSIIISAVLVPLACGYYFGGNYQGNVHAKLIRNFINANICLIFGLSYTLFELYFAVFVACGIKSYILQTCIFSIIFIVYPVFLLGQTIPLISNYIKHHSISKVAGKILFISTLGSFFGSILNTLVLMPFIGVNHAVIMTIAIVSYITFILERKILSYNNALNILILTVAILLNHPQDNIIANNAYNTISIIEEDTGKILSINRSYSAKIPNTPQDNFEYLQFIEKRFIEPLLQDDTEKKDILVLGAGGFTTGRQDTKNNYTYVDIDASLQKISEKHFLPEPIAPNKIFIDQPARAFVKHHNMQYDLIIVDLYTHAISIPFQTITQEFFFSIKLLLKDKGIIVFNMITSPNFTDDYSIKLNNTLHKVFPNLNREVIGEYNSWVENTAHNIIYSYFSNNRVMSETYTDNNNPSFYDKCMI